MDNNSAIKTMKLYSHVDRIHNELKELGYDRESTLKEEDVCRFDQYHYYGVTAVADAIAKLKITSSSRILDIGAGLGGPARYLASQTKCNVTAVELQADLNETNADLTRRCGLADHITCICGDFLQMDLGTLGQYDCIISWLTFLHIPNKKELFDRCNQVLKPGGQMFIEDFFMKSPFNPSEDKKLKTGVYSEELQTRAEYETQLQTSGFLTQFDDCTDSWTRFVKGRLEAHQADRDRYTRVHGQQVFNEQEQFFTIMYDLFSGGNLGGCKVTATKQ